MLNINDQMTRHIDFVTENNYIFSRWYMYNFKIDLPIVARQTTPKNLKANLRASYYQVVRRLFIVYQVGADTCCHVLSFTVLLVDVINTLMVQRKDHVVEQLISKTAELNNLFNNMVTSCHNFLTKSRTGLAITSYYPSLHENSLDFPLTIIIVLRYEFWIP